MKWDILLCAENTMLRHTWPYFLPFPSFFGTLGAVIKMKGHIPSKRALFDIGVAGPIGGLIFAIPITLIGLHLSEVQPIPKDATSYLGLGEPILFSLFSKMMVGEVSEGFDIILNPIAFAGWAGLFVTALNLMPIGQLDGGHVIYALLGKHSTIVYKVGIGIFCLFAIFVYYRAGSLLPCCYCCLDLNIRHQQTIYTTRFQAQMCRSVNVGCILSLFYSNSF